MSGPKTGKNISENESRKKMDFFASERRRDKNIFHPLSGVCSFLQNLPNKGEGEKKTFEMWLCDFCSMCHSCQREVGLVVMRA